MTASRHRRNRTIVGLVIAALSAGGSYVNAAAGAVRDTIDAARTTAWQKASGAGILSQIGTGGILPAKGITVGIGSCTVTVSENGQLVDEVQKPRCDWSHKPGPLRPRQYYNLKTSAPTAVLDDHHRLHVTIGLCGGGGDDMIAYLVKEPNGDWNPAVRLPVDGPCHWHEDGRTHKHEWKTPSPGVGISKNGQRLHVWTEADSWSKANGPTTITGSVHQVILDQPSDIGNLLGYLSAKLLGQAPPANQMRIADPSKHRVALQDARIVDYWHATDEHYPRAVGGVERDGTFAIHVPAFLEEMAGDAAKMFMTVDLLDEEGTIFGSHTMLTTDTFKLKDGAAADWPFDFVRLPDWALSALTALGLEVPATLPTRLTHSDIASTLDGFAGTTDLADAIEKLVVVNNGILAQGGLTIAKPQAVAVVKFSTLLALMQARGPDPLRRVEIDITDEHVDLSIYPQGWFQLIPRLTKKIAREIAKAKIETAFTAAQLKLNTYSEQINLQLVDLLSEAFFRLVVEVTQTAIEQGVLSNDVWDALLEVKDNSRNNVAVESPILYHPFGVEGGDPEPYVSMELAIGSPRSVPVAGVGPAGAAWAPQRYILGRPGGPGGGPCTANSCDDGDKCTADTCTATGCVQIALPGTTGILCRLDDFDACTGQMPLNLSALVERKIATATRLVQKAQNARKPRKQRVLLRRAMGNLAALQSTVERARKRGKVASDCADAIQRQSQDLVSSLQQELPPK